MFDIILFLEYINYSGASLDINDLAETDYSPLFGNVTCTVYNSSISADGQDVCVKYVKYDYWFSILTLLFIYLPSVNVIATLYGPKTAGNVGMKMSLVMAVVGGVSSLIGYFMSSPVTSVIGWFVFILSSGILCMGWINYWSGKTGKTSSLHFIMFIPLVVFSPVIFLAIKFFAIFKSGNTLLQSQATYGSRGEGILEAAPQFGLQIYIVMLTLNPTMNQVLSILTSAATLSLPNIENFVTARGGDFGFKSIVKNILIFLPACLFKILSVAIFCVFLRGWVVLIIVGTIGLVFAALILVYFCCDIFKPEDQIQDDNDQQGFECTILAWLTIAGLGKTKLAAVFRLVSTLTVTITYSLLLGTLMIICNGNVDQDFGYVYGFGFQWSDLEIAKDPFYLNLLLGSTIGIGWISFLMDIIITIPWCKAGFWKEAVLLQGLGA